MHNGEKSVLKKYSASGRLSTSGVRWNNLPMRARGMGAPGRFGLRPNLRGRGSGRPGAASSVAPMERDVLSYCRICAASCGLTVTVDGDQVRKVRGDAEHPVSRGYTCSKGRGLADWHHSPVRLDRPRLHGADVSWDDALDDIAAVLRDTIGGSGADAVALYLATG